MSFSRFYSGTNFNKNFALQNNLTLQARAISIINVFRLLLSLIFVVVYAFADKLNLSGGSDNPSLFLSLAIAYVLFSISLLVITPLKSSAVIFFHPVQIVIDILFIIMMMYAAGGIQSGLGLLLIVTIVTASMVSNGRLAIFYAAVATIGLLLEQSYRIVEWGLSISSYTQSVMLSLSCFATAWLAYSLAKRILQSEALASSRGVDLENLAQVNALITQQMQDGVLVVDEHLNIRHHNSQAMLLLALEKNSANDLGLRDHAPAIANLLLYWIDGNDEHKNLIIPVNNRELNLRIEPINQENRKLGAVIFIQDWSKIQAAAQQAKLAALGRLTANIAHEIRNPLSAISHANQLLQEEENLSKANTRILEIIEDNIQRINQIIKDVLELNRRDRTHQEKILLSQFIIDFHTQFCSIEKIPATHFTLELCPAQDMILFDRRHLTQILWNLCKNAWEHGRKEVGSLHLHCTKTIKSASNTKAGLHIEVIDDGAGITEQDRSKLFEPFYTTKTTGNGLGLYISRELAEANNAQLNFQSLDRGTAFILELRSTN
ncbi:MAG TPA: HAMP domain-containing sensor histidine kinase [Methylotenera sp.]